MKFILKGLIVLSLLVLIGCSKVTQSNYDKIQPGMTRSQVVAILGQPTSEGGVGMGQLSGTSVVWKSGDTTITIVFVNDKVKLKSISGEKMLKIQALDKDGDQNSDASSNDATQDNSTQDNSQQNQ